MSKRHEYKYAEDLPIAKVAHDVLLDTLRATRGMERTCKYDIGVRMVDSVLEIEALIAEAHFNTANRVNAVMGVLKEFSKLQSLYRVACDSQALGFRVMSKEVYVKVMPKLASLQRQAVGWLRSISPNDDIFQNTQVSPCVE